MRAGKGPPQKGARVVQDLTRDFQHRWHRCFFDTSKRLLCDLLEVGCGTCRKDRKLFPEELKNCMFVFKTHIPRGESLTGDVAASVWLDNKVVTVMYAGSSPLEETTVQRMQKNDSRLSFSYPEALSCIWGVLTEVIN